MTLIPVSAILLTSVELEICTIPLFGSLSHYFMTQDIVVEFYDMRAAHQATHEDPSRVKKMATYKL